MPEKSNNAADRQKKIEAFLLDPEKTIFETITEFEGAVSALTKILSGVDLDSLEKIQGKDGHTPERGVDYFTPEDIQALQDFIMSKIPKVGADLPSVQQVEDFIRNEVAKIPRIKGDKGDSIKGEDGKDGSPDSAVDIVKKIRTLGKNQMLRIDDIRGLENFLKKVVTDEEFAALEEKVNNFKIVIPANPGGGGNGNDATAIHSDGVGEFASIAADTTPAAGDYFIAERASDGVKIKVPYSAIVPAGIFFNIADYGAVIDGSTNDTAAVQAAIDAAEDAGGGVIFHPGGNCRIGKVTVSISKGITFAGTGWGSQYQAIDNLNDNMIQFAVNIAGMWVNFENLKFDGNSGSQTNGNIIDAPHAIECRFSKVWFHQPYNWAVNLYGHVPSGAFGHHNNFVQCLFDEGQGSAGQGGAIKCDDNDENSAIGCEFQYMGGSGSTYNCSILDNSGLNNWSFNTFVDSRSGIYILDASQTRVVGNIFDRVQYDSIFIKGHANIVTNNQIYEIGGPRSGTGVASGVVIDYYGQNDVSHNFFKASPTNNRTRSFIHDLGGGASGHNSFIGNKIKDDGGTTSAAAWDITSTPNTRHSNDGDDVHQVMLADDSEQSIIGGGGGSGITWSEVTTTTQAAAVNSAYIANNASLVQITLPASADVGDTVIVVGKGAGGWSLLCSPGQTILYDGGSTTVGRDSGADTDAVELICTTADDTWTYRNHEGTHVDTTPTAAFSLLFDGTNDKSQIADASDLEGLNTGTLEFYFKTSYGAGYQKLFRKDGVFDLGITQNFGGGAKVFCEVVGAGNLGDFGPNVADGVWRHCAISWDGTTIRAFLDGTQVDSTSQGAAQGIGSSPMYVGHSAGSEYFNGLISKIRYSNIARYTSSFTAPTADFSDDANTIFLYLLTEGSGNPADASGNGHTLTLDGTNPPAWSSTLPY